MTKSRSGFSLIEVMVFVTLVSIILVAATSYTVQIIRHMSYNQNKLYAARYADDLKEWLDGERFGDWNEFQSYASTGAGTTYCANSQIGLSFEMTNLELVGPTCTFSGITPSRGQMPMIFQRTLNLQKNADNASTIVATITVSWYEDNPDSPESEVLVTSYSLWQ